MVAKEMHHVSNKTIRLTRKDGIVSLGKDLRKSL
jgi:hypothetical protein